jgi:carbon-monoxide dehydrogenase iron sulfur subunit
MALGINKQEQCVGCLQCEMICSITHNNAFAPWLSKVHIKRNERTLECWPIICRQCKNAKCEAACPVQAIRMNESNTLVVQSDECIGCKACVEACPFGAMFFDNEKNVAFKCDLCNGKPQCVSVCPANVLLYKERVKDE